MSEDRSTWKARVKDPRWWIAVFFVIRLIGIANAPIEIGHAWRQCLTAMIARNLEEDGFDLLHPKVDMGGSDTGIIGSEFPLLNALIALTCHVFGPAHWYGRLIVLILSSLGIWAFARTIRTLFGERMSLTATLFILASVWFQFSRKIMPDTFSVALVLIAIDQALFFVNTSSRRSLVAYALFLLLGTLSKMPALTLLPALIVPLLLEGVTQWRVRWVLIATIPAFVAVVLWYFTWVPHLVSTYHYPLYFPRTLATGLKELWEFRALTANMFYFEAFRSFLIVPFLLIGLWFFAKEGSRQVIVATTVCAATFLFFMLKAGEVFAHHSYYIVPFVPIMAVIGAFGLERLPVRWANLMLAAICVEATANQVYDLDSPYRRNYLVQLERKADDCSTRNDLIVVNGELDPTYMYFLHRKGWSLTSASCADPEVLDSLAAHGAKRLFLFNERPVLAAFPLIHQDEQVTVFDLTLSKH